MIARPRRSVLYMPGSNPRAIAKARSLPADAIILDLEDSVAPEAKTTAREQVVAAVREGGFGRREVVIRINGVEFALGPRRSGGGRPRPARRDPACPKSMGQASVMQVARELREAGAPERIRLWAMMETPMAILHAGSIAAVAADPGSRLEVLVMGLNDLAKETRARFVSRPQLDDRLARALRGRCARPWRRHSRWRLQRHRRSQGIRGRMPAGARYGP